MNKVDPSNPTPLYEQLKFIIQDQIMNGEFRPGTHLPSESALCDRYGVSRITVVRALNDLESDGILQRVQGSGTIVKPRQIDSQFESVMGFTKNMHLYGKQVSSQVLSIENLKADDTLLHIFRLEPGEEDTFVKFRRLRCVDGVPGAIMTSIVRNRLGKKMQEYDLESASFYSLYQEITHLPIIRNETSIVPIIASPEISDLLKVKPGSPHFLFTGLGFTEDETPIEYNISVFSGSLFQFTTNIYKLRDGNSAQYASKELL